MDQVATITDKTTLAARANAIEKKIISRRRYTKLSRLYCQ